MPEQTNVLSKLGVSVVHADLFDAEAVSKAILENKSRLIARRLSRCTDTADRLFSVDIVLNMAHSMAPEPVLNIIRALGERHKMEGSKVHVVHVCFPCIA
jgi:hypothetical protein